MKKILPFYYETPLNKKSPLVKMMIEKFNKVWQSIFDDKDYKSNSVDLKNLQKKFKKLFKTFIYDKTSQKRDKPLCDKYDSGVKATITQCIKINGKRDVILLFEASFDNNQHAKFWMQEFYCLTNKSPIYNSEYKTWSEGSSEDGIEENFTKLNFGEDLPLLIKKKNDFYGEWTNIFYAKNPNFDKSAGDDNTAKKKKKEERALFLPDWEEKSSKLMKCYSTSNETKTSYDLRATSNFQRMA